MFCAVGKCISLKFNVLLSPTTAMIFKLLTVGNWLDHVNFMLVHKKKIHPRKKKGEQNRRVFFMLGD